MKRLLPVLLVVALLGCAQEEHEDLRQWMDSASKDIKGRIPPLPQVRPYEPVPYDAGNLMDPFRPGKIGTEQKKGGGGLRPDMDRPREPLEAYPLESLKYVGVITKKKVSYALIQVDGSLFQVRNGNYMGQYLGVITQISDAEVVL